MNFLLALLAVLPFVQIVANAKPIDNYTGCLDQLNLDLEDLFVPEGVEKLANNVRSLNPSLQDESLNKLLADKRAELNLYKAGLIKEGEDGPLVDACADYVTTVMEVMRATSCGQELIELSENDQTKFDKILDKNPGLEKAYGYARACLRLL